MNRKRTKIVKTKATKKRKTTLKKQTTSIRQTTPKQQRGAKQHAAQNLQTPKIRKKKKMKLEVYIPRLRNKAFPEESNLNTEQIKFFDEHIFTDDNLTAFKKCGESSDSRQHKIKFVNNLTSTVIGSNVVVKRYNEELKAFEQLSFEDIVNYLFARFARKKSKVVNKELMVRERILPYLGLEIS